MKIYFLGVLLFCAGTLLAQKNISKIPLIGEDAPAFEAESTLGIINFPQDYGRKWKILFSHPRDFTPVCSSEILELASMQEEFSKLGVKPVVLSTDTKDQHIMWQKTLEEISFKGRDPVKINFPLVEDKSGAMAKMYGMLHYPVSTTESVRGVFIVDPDNKIRAIFFYPMSVGRDLKEIERVIIALQTVDGNQYATPVNWKPGEDVLVTHFPYTDKELEKEPAIKHDYYNVGNLMWFKKTAKQQP